MFLQCCNLLNYIFARMLLWHYVICLEGSCAWHFWNLPRQQAKSPSSKSDANCVSVLAKQTLIVVIKTDRVGQFFHSELQDEYQRGHRVIVISLWPTYRGENNYLIPGWRSKQSLIFSIVLFEQRDRITTKIKKNKNKNMLHKSYKLIWMSLSVIWIWSPTTQSEIWFSQIGCLLHGHAAQYITINQSITDTPDLNSVCLF